MGQNTANFLNSAELNDAAIDDARKIWISLAGRLRSVLGAGDFKAWIAPLIIENSDNNNIYFLAPNGFAKSRVRVEYLHRLQAIWNDFDPKKRRLIINAQDSVTAPEARPIFAGASEVVPSLAKAPLLTNESADSESQTYNLAQEPVDLALCPKQFENFEEGASNRIAIAIARRAAVEANFGELVYLHGFNGVGKTHLLSAIANKSFATNPNRRVVSLSAQRFLHLFQSALRDRDTNAFKEGLRNADILLVDDIQLICGKAATQEEFFQTIIDLLAASKTVICTGDVPPDALIGLNQRMKGILIGGFNVRIDEPDFELRRKIAIAKAREFALKRPDFSPPQQAFDILAARIIGTGRAVEGAVKQIFASSALIGQEATLEVVLEAIADRFGAPSKSLPVETIKKRVAAHFEISIEDLIGPRRHIAVARPRQIAMYFCKKFTKRSYPDIAARMGGRDHTTVMHAVKRIEELASNDPNFAASLQTLANKLLA